MADNTIERDYFTTRKALAEYLGVSERTIERWDALREGPARTMVGGRVMYRRAAVADWLKSREERAAA